MKYIYTSLAALSLCFVLQAQDIKLEIPSKTGGVSIMEAFSLRQSNIAYIEKELKLSDLSNLLWAANGINRENGKKTAPSAQNSQDIDIYVALPKAVYKYNAVNNNLELIAEGDYRNLAGGKKEGAEPPCILYLVADASKYKTSAYNTVEHRTNMGKVDAGIVSQNISLFCSGMGLGTKPRAQMNKEELTKALKLSENQSLILNHPIGYLK